MKSEGLRTEYKQEYTPNVVKSIISFLNIEGGTYLSSKESYEETPSLNQRLTFGYSIQNFKDFNIKLEEEQMRTLGLACKAN